jgi:hypothetical protein
LLGDLVYARILANETLGDSIALFDSSTHANLGSDALGSAGLTNGFSAISGCTLDSHGVPQHPNLRARFLVVPPALEGVGRELLDTVANANRDDLQLRVESRIGATGCWDHQSGQLRTGSDSAWYLAARAANRPCLVLSTYSGTTAPRVRDFELEGGRFGRGFDIEISAHVQPIDFRGLYKSDT